MPGIIIRLLDGSAGGLVNMSKFLTIQLKNAKKVIGEIDSTIEKTTVRSLNEVTRGMAKVGRIAAREEYNIKAKRINKGTRIIKAKRNSLIATIEYKQKRPGLQNFKAKAYGTGIRHTGRGKKRKFIHQAFIQSPKLKGGIGVFMRVNPGNLKNRKIKRLAGSSIPHMIGEVGFERMRKHEAQMFPIIFDRNLKFFKTRHGIR